MGMKSLMCEILVDKQKELIESFESQLKAKNEIIIKEAKRANEMFKLSYNRKLQIKEQQAEIDRLEETLTRTIGTLYLIAELHPDVSVIALNCILRIKTALRY